MSDGFLISENRVLPATLLKYTPILLIALTWEAATRSGIVGPHILPPLSQVTAAWFRLAIDGDLFFNGVSSLYRTFTGLTLAVVVGGATGILMGWSRLFDVAVGPLIRMFYPMPKSALIPMMALWLGFGDGSKIVLIFLGCMLPVAISGYNGARGTDRTLIWSARSLGASRWRTLIDVVAPSALPEMMSGIRIALATSFILLVSSELIAARKGLGYMIGVLGEGGVYDAMFATVLTVALLGFFADRGYLVLMRRVLRWRS
jgi:ABC-type nitrate/sulfonate/bicarbonate transport system permease component